MQIANWFNVLIKRVFVLYMGIGRNHIQGYLNWDVYIITYNL